MDKIVAKKWLFFSSGQNCCFLFRCHPEQSVIVCILASSNETETGSAGEQPVRDKFDI